VRVITVARDAHPDGTPRSHTVLRTLATCTTVRGQEFRATQSPAVASPAKIDLSSWKPLASAILRLLRILTTEVPRWPTASEAHRVACHARNAGAGSGFDGLERERGITIKATPSACCTRAGWPHLSAQPDRYSGHVDFSYESRARSPPAKARCGVTRHRAWKRRRWRTLYLRLIMALEIIP